MKFISNDTEYDNELNEMIETNEWDRVYMYACVCRGGMNGV